ncbi:MAG: benzaldehyde dehydrogenase, partial [Mycobacterium sp.]|nr:benzaldehyde dehydrogenase [Mycobacterium sp.]
MSLLSDTTWQGSLFDGAWHPAPSHRAAVEPATGATLADVGMATPADVTEVAATAAAAQRSWAALPYPERAAVLRRAGDLFTSNSAEIIDWIVRESGSIPGKAAFEIETVAQECYEAAALASAPYGEMLRSSQPRLSFSRRMPVGLVGVISPFNVPIILSMRAVAPALALGNAVI